MQKIQDPEMDSRQVSVDINFKLENSAKQQRGKFLFLNLVFLFVRCGIPVLTENYTKGKIIINLLT